MIEIVLDKSGTSSLRTKIKVREQFEKRSRTTGIVLNHSTFRTNQVDSRALNGLPDVSDLVDSCTDSKNEEIEEAPQTL